MTDQIELPTVPQSPPLVRLAGYGDDAPGVILFNSASPENTALIVNLNIRDEDQTETLKMRWRVVGNVMAPGAPAEPYACPEPEILGDGDPLRSAILVVQGNNFARNSCHRVDVIVSASFKMCRPDRDDGWDNTTQEDNDTDVGRLSFLVWAYDGATNDPRVSQTAALAVTQSCTSYEFQPPSATATETSAATGM